LTMTFGEGDHWLYLCEDKTFSWDSRQSVPRGEPRSTIHSYTADLFKELFPGLVSEYVTPTETNSNNSS